MLNAGSILNQTDELVDLAQHMNVDIIGITAAWLHDGIRADGICLPGYTLFRQGHSSHDREMDVNLYVISDLLTQSLMLPIYSPSPR